MRELSSELHLLGHRAIPARTKEMIIFIISGVIIIAAFVTIYLVHRYKAKEEKRLQFERQVKELESQARRYEPLISRIRPHLLPYNLRLGLAERWLDLLQQRRDLGDKSHNFLSLLQEAEERVSQVKVQIDPPVQPIEDKQRCQETLNQLKNVQFLIMKDYREGRLSESKGQAFMNDLRHSATQVVVEMNQTQADQLLKSKKYRAAMICLDNITKELKKYKGTDQTHFREVLKNTKATLEKIKPLAKHEMNTAPNPLAEGVLAMEEEKTFQSDVEKAVTASRDRAKNQLI